MFISEKTYNQIPTKIISLVPSITELLADLGLENETVGITKFCVHPTNWYKNKIRIGGTKNVNISLVKTLQPDLIICSKEENIKEQVDELAAEFPVLLTDVCNFEDAIAMIKTIGNITQKNKEAENIISAIETDFKKLDFASKNTAAYIIWNNPLMTIGNDTFIHNMMQHAGFENVFADAERYPSISIEDLQQKNPDVILLSSEPYPFKEKHIAKFQALLPNTKILLVDGEIFSWYGSRMKYAASYFIDLQNKIHNTNLH